MKKTNKGFTIVELVVVIAVVAVLAAVLIPTFTSIIKKANDSAYLQERQSKQIEDLAEKIDNQNYLTWGDFEKELAEAMAKATKTGDELSAEIKTAVEAALEKYDDKGITEEQAKKIIEKSLEGVLSREQVEGIVNAAVAKAGQTSSITTAQVQAIVNAAIAQLPTSTGITASQMQIAITSAINSLKDTYLTQEQIEALIKSGVHDYVKDALDKYEAAQLKEEDISEIVAKVLVLSGAVEGDAYLNGTIVYFGNLTPEGLSDGDTVKLLKSTEIFPWVYVGNNKITVDLNGYTIKLDHEGEKSQGDGQIGILNGGSITFKDSKGGGKIIFTGNGSFDAIMNVTIAFDGVIFDASGCTESPFPDSMIYSGITLNLINNAEIIGPTAEGVNLFEASNVNVSGTGKITYKSGQLNGNSTNISIGAGITQNPQ